jgi:hypothetical protein
MPRQTAHTILYDATKLIWMRRGPQIGYLSVLESRLVATEVALYEVLSKLHSLNDVGPNVSTEDLIARLQKKYTDMPYSAKTAEWQQQPLAGELNHQQWWQERQKILEAPDRPFERPQQPRTNMQMPAPPWIPATPDEKLAGPKRRTSSIQAVDTGEGMVSTPRSIQPSMYSPTSATTMGYGSHQIPEQRASVQQDPPMRIDPELSALSEQQLRKYF